MAVKSELKSLNVLKYSTNINNNHWFLIIFKINFSNKTIFHTTSQIKGFSITMCRYYKFFNLIKI